MRVQLTSFVCLLLFSSVQFSVSIGRALLLSTFQQSSRQLNLARG